VSLDILGDHWSLLIVRDTMVRGYRRFKQSQESGEGIASNISAELLRKLESAGIIVAVPHAVDRRRLAYRLTATDVDLAQTAFRAARLGRASRTNRCAVHRDRRDGGEPCGP
jgi:DNA-binding HxlR family transcriptional regulator